MTQDVPILSVRDLQVHFHTRRGVGYLLRGQAPDAQDLGGPDLAGG